MTTGKQRSAGVLLYRNSRDNLEVLLVHPGGPFWRAKDKGAWQIPKGVIEPAEAGETAARREAQEELGVPITGPLKALGTIRQAGGKWVEAFAAEQDIDVTQVRSNSFRMEWPPRSGRFCDFPEVDSARWFPLDQAGEWMLASQRPLLGLLAEMLARTAGA